MNIIKWFQKRRQTIEKGTHDAGYDYAAGALLRGDRTPLSLEAVISTYDKSSFDYGMEAAIADLIRLKLIKDDRIW